jgi:hypothetical protein
MAVVVLIKFVMGSASFLPRRFSSGVSEPNNLMILINIQLLHCPLVRSLYSTGARLR